MKKYILTIIAAVALNANAQEAGTPTPKNWDHESQASVVQTSGNSESDTYSVKQSTSYKFEKELLKATASYLRASGTNPDTNNKGETARIWDAGLRLERTLIVDKLDAFTAYKVESDKYAGFQQRHSTDLGAKYFFVKEEKFNTFGETGYRYTHENRTDDTQNHFHGGRVYVETNYAFNPSNSVRLWVEYVPNFNVSEDYLINYEGSLTSALNTYFALKVAYLSKTDNLPVAGKEKTDSTLTTALVAKF